GLAAEAGVAVGDVDRMVRQKESAFLANLHAVRPLELVVAVAAEHRGRLPLAVASGGYRETITRTLDQLGIRGWFAALVTAEDTARHKPGPDGFLGAAKGVGGAAGAGVVVGGSHIGLEGPRP